MKPYLKLFALILASTLVIRLQGLSLQASAAVLLWLVLGRRLFSRLRPLLPLLLIIIILQTVLAGFDRGLTAALKIANLSLLVLAYTSLTPVREISQTFAFLGASTQLLLTLTLNLVPIILKEWQAISLVQKSRGGRSLNPFPVIVPLIHRTFARSEQLAIIIGLSATGEGRTHTDRSTRP